MKKSCEYAGICGGCGWISISYQKQLDSKKNQLLAALSELSLSAYSLDTVSTLEFRSRDRVDLTLKDGQIGLYSLDGTHRIVDIQSCLQMSEGLEVWFQEFRQNLPDIKVGSVRLRIGPSGQRGVWLDFPNEDIKRLLDDGNWLSQLSERSIVEIGQKRKRLVFRNAWKLAAYEDGAELRPWFQTFLEEEQEPFDLLGPIGGFTQPGMIVNKKLVAAAMELVRASPSKKWLELGSGWGNFTFPLLMLSEAVVAVESDPLALFSLRRNADAFSQKRGQGFFDELQISSTSFHKASVELAEMLTKCDGLFVDPPRSGLGGMLNLIENQVEKPATLIYVSCYPESFAADTRKLLDSGYTLSHIKIVDQFPQTSHYEIVARFNLGLNT